MGRIPVRQRINVVDFSAKSRFKPKGRFRSRTVVVEAPNSRRVQASSGLPHSDLNRRILFTQISLSACWIFMRLSWLAQSRSHNVQHESNTRLLCLSTSRPRVLALPYCWVIGCRYFRARSCLRALSDNLSLAMRILLLELGIPSIWDLGSCTFVMTSSSTLISFNSNLHEYLGTSIL